MSLAIVCRGALETTTAEDVESAGLTVAIRVAVSVSGRLERGRAEA